MFAFLDKFTISKNCIYCKNNFGLKVKDAFHICECTQKHRSHLKCYYDFLVNSFNDFYENNLNS